MSEKPPGIDLSHHLSEATRSRGVSPLKGMYKYINQPGLIALAGGMPPPQYFPFAELSAQALVKDSFPAAAHSGSSLSWLWKWFGSSSERTTTISVPKYAETPGDLSLEVALQYGMATGIAPLAKLIKEFTGKVFQPNYANFETIPTIGNTDGWSKSVQLLCNPGEGVLTDEWTYPGAMSTMRPWNVTPIPISMDSEGLRVDALRNILANWDVTVRGMARPHVLYTIPVGQNPTGATMSGQRKKEIYEVCVEYDVIIVEDDPYYFLQEGAYVPKKDRKPSAALPSDEEYIAQLAPSFLKYDYQGRVVRLDTFSKTVAPGCRLGWITCNPLFSERLQRITETTTAVPSGFVQSMTAALLLKWQFSGYVRWLRGLGAQYTERRDYMIDCLAEEFSLHGERASAGFREGTLVYHASLKSENTLSEKPKSTVFSFVPPTGGMFLWIGIRLDDHPHFQSIGAATLEQLLWERLAEGGVLFGPGFMFSPDQQQTGGSTHYRIAFSTATHEEMKKAMSIFRKVLTEFMKEK